jgi:voltage-gated potassium channel
MSQSEPAYKRTLRNGITFFVTTCIISTSGYVMAGWEWIDAIYMVTITIFGVGYGEVHPMESNALKLFTMCVILVGCSSLLYVIGGIIQLLAEGEIARMLGVRNQSRELDQLNDHTIICGYGRVGQMLAVELSNQDQPLVILDRTEARVEQARADGFLAVLGDAVDDDVLHRVRLLHAKTIASVLPDDATNVFITLTARDMCASIQIIARAESPCTERKLLRGGASHVVMPAAIGAVRIAQLATSKDDTASLPEKRYRMLSAQACRTQQPIEEEIETIEEIGNDLDDLASQASDLSRSVDERRQEQWLKMENLS